MSNCYDLPNPLLRDGVSQRQRQAPALSPSYVKVDERQLADFLVFAYKLSQQLIYYNAGNQRDGDWQAFWQGSTPVWLALIGKTRPEEVKETYNRQLKSFLANRSAASLVPVLVTWGNLLTQIKDWYEKLEAYTPFKSIIKGLVKTNLREAIVRMWAFEQAYINQTGKAATEFNYQDFAKSFNLAINSIPVAASTPLKGTLLEARTELDAVFQVLWQNYRQIVQRAPQYLTHSLIARQDHQPHLSLYLAFLKIFQLARDDLNRMTQRHLDFFYRDVLRLPKKQAVPDQAYLIFELAKSQKEYKLEANTSFKAGKDNSGVELFYKLDEEVIVHKGQVNSLKGLFLDSEEMATGKIPQNLRGFTASPVANSFDGKGQDFPKDQAVKAWLPFGDKGRSLAQLGLAIASDILLLQEGKRTITLKLTIKENQIKLGDTPLTPKRKFSELSQSELFKLFKVNFSGDKGWVEVELNSVEPLTSLESGTYLLSITIELTADLPPLVPYNAKVHGSVLKTEKPVIWLQLNTEKNSQIEGLSPYNFLRPLKLMELTVTTAVDQVRNLILQNDLGVIDPTKPFPAFGAQPKSNANLYIGSQEVFQKSLTQLKIHLVLEESVPIKKSGPNWSDRYAGYGSTPSSSIQWDVKALRQKRWEPEEQNKAVTLNLFSPSPLSLNKNQLKNLKLYTSQATEANESWTHQSKNGFLRLQLSGGDFLHDEYPTVLSRQVLAAATNEIIKVSNGSQEQEKRKAVIGAYYRKANGTIIKGGEDGKYYVDVTDEPIIPKEPYTPVITSLYLSYTAETNYPKSSQDGEAEGQDIYLFHLYPFDGFKEISENNAISLLPTFTDEGTLYIGLQDLEPPTALPLLFQVAEETADTNLARAKVEWYYLKDNSWKQLQDHQIVSDTTKGLIASGIVNLAIPSDISKAKTTILDSKLYWLKVSVPARSKAICRVIGVYTQAARVTFSNQGNDPNHLATPLAAGTITKLAVPQAQLKKVEQPYDSFGGQLKEQAAHFYTRISEQLRHKGRAVTIFDYERLVLEKFPQIYKVRCINHGQIDPTGQLRELRPGAVTMAVIPDLSQRRTTNDLEPKINISLLKEIEDYLSQLSSSWVEIRVVNPQYERIRVRLQVQFKEPYQANFGYYRRQLERDIIGFLSPWTVDSGAEINFGGKMYRSSILNFVEERTYVNYVLKCEMDLGGQINVREVAASSARSILVSVPFADSEDEGHIIKQVETHPPNKPIAAGKLGYEPLKNWATSQ